jgi:hypothetical protein
MILGSSHPSPAAQMGAGNAWLGAGMAPIRDRVPVRERSSETGVFTPLANRPCASRREYGRGLPAAPTATGRGHTFRRTLVPWRWPSRAPLLLLWSDRVGRGRQRANDAAADPRGMNELPILPLPPQPHIRARNNSTAPPGANGPRSWDREGRDGCFAQVTRDHPSAGPST